MPDTVDDFMKRFASGGTVDDEAVSRPLCVDEPGRLEF